IAGVSSKHVAFLETGRASPSREMVLLLARALEVPLRDRNLLLRAAGFADAYRESGLDAPSIEPARRALRFILKRHEPYPAMVIDASWNVLIANHAASRLVARFVDRPVGAGVNLLRMLFDPSALRPFVVNWPQIASVVLERLHREAMDGGASSATRALLDD